MKHFNYSRGTGNKKNWLIAEEQFDGRYLGKCEAIFCQGNGYLGVRHALEEEYTGTVRDMFVSGTFDQFCENEVTELPNLPDVTKMVLLINDRPFSLEQGTILGYERTMDLSNGEVVRYVEWEDREGSQVRFTFRRFVSMDDRHVIAAKIEAEPLNGDIELKMISGIDGTVTNSGTQHFSEGSRRLYDYKYLEMVSETVESGITAGIYSTHRFFLDEKEYEPDILPIMERREIKISAGMQLKAGQKLVIEKLSALYTGRDREYIGMEKPEIEKKLMESGQEHIRRIYKLGYDCLKENSEKKWERIWEREDVRISSANPFDQLAVRFAVYHLNIMVNREDNRVGIGAKALTGEGYKGHSFWDTEVFILPYFLLTDPDTARTLLEYRYQNLSGAHRKAAEYGYEGAMYPWEAAWIDDGEVTPVWGPADVVTGKPMKYLTGLIEQHITADIAFAVWQYYIATDDEAFMEACGYELILDTAKFWVSRMEWKAEKGQYEITDVIGPDEYKEHVDNNAYTNYLAYYNMKLAKELLRQLVLERGDLYRRLDDKMNLERLRKHLAERMELLYLPKPEGTDGIIAQFEGYFDLEYLDLTKYKASSEVLTIYNDYSPAQINGYQVSKQGDLVVLFYLIEDLFDERIKRNNYLYYEERTLHDSSLSKCTHGVVATDLGLHEEAYQFYQGASKVDLGEEMKSSNAGIHSAAMGGIWQVAILGFGGIRIADGKLRIHPSMPDAWDCLEFTVVWHGSPLRICVTKDQVSVENKGDEVRIMLLGEEKVLAVGELCVKKL